MALTYQYRFVTLSVPQGTTNLLAFGANPRRVSLAISAVNSGVVRVSSSAVPLLYVWFFYSSLSVRPFTYRDFGPIMQGPIYISHTGNQTATIAVVETYTIGACA